MFENHESVRQNGTWDPNLMPTGWLIRRTAARGTTCGRNQRCSGKPSPRSRHSCSGSALRSSCTAVLPVAGWRGRRSPCPTRRGLGRRYRVNVNYLPQTWSGGQVFTVDVTQDWDDPHYDEPAETTKACRLQPGETADDLSLQCPDTFRGFRGGQRRRPRRRPTPPEQGSAGETIPRVPGPGSDDPSDQYATDPYEQYEPDPYDYYEPEQMFPVNERRKPYAAPLHKSAGLPSRRWLSGSSR